MSAPAKHTPGPWIVSAYDGGAEVRAAIGDSEYMDVAILADADSQPVQANAALIAAAPDLLAAGIRMLVGITGKSLPGCDWYEGIEHDGADEFRAALSKAEGRA